jgi:hypothetical protein
MVDKIEVYIRNEEVVAGDTVGGEVVGEHGCTVIRCVKTEKVMPEADKIALSVATEFAKEKSLNVEVCNVSTVKGKLKASLKGIKTTPTIVVGDLKIEGEHTPDMLKSKLETHFNK